MKKIIKLRSTLIRSIILEVIIMTILPSLAGCMEPFQSTPKVVEKKLSEKYGIEFKATTIGDRINTGSATLVCHPVSDERVNFTVVYKSSEKTMTDDYIRRKNAVAIDSELSEAAKKSGFSITALTVFYGATDDSLNGNEDLPEFIRVSGTEKLYTNLAVNADEISDGSDAQRVLDVISAVSQKYDDIDVLAPMYLYHSDDYEKCSAGLSSKSRANNEWFASFSPVSEFVVKIENGTIQQTAEELLAAAKG